MTNGKINRSVKLAGMGNALGAASNAPDSFAETKLLMVRSLLEGFGSKPRSGAGTQRQTLKTSPSHLRSTEKVASTYFLKLRIPLGISQ
nr:hypothetical protein [uncultured Acetatifactor sp.]